MLRSEMVALDIQVKMKKNKEKKDEGKKIKGEDAFCYDRDLVYV